MIQLGPSLLFIRIFDTVKFFTIISVFIFGLIIFESPLEEKPLRAKHKKNHKNRKFKKNYSHNCRCLSKTT